MAKTTKVLAKRRKFLDVEIPLIDTKVELIGNSTKEIENRTLKLDLTRQLRGKGVEAKFVIVLNNDKAIAIPKKIKLMPYFIRRMIRKNISYVEDSFSVPSQESMIEIKPFLITRKKVSRAVRKTLRNKTKNWIEDYISQKKDNEIFSEMLSNKMQKPLSLMLKKTYPLSLCEIRVLEVKRKLNPEEVPKIKEVKETEKKKVQEEETFIDQLKEIEDEKIKKAQEDIKKTQEKAVKKEKETKSDEKIESEKDNTKEVKEKPKKETKKKPKKDDKE